MPIHYDALLRRIRGIRMRQILRVDCHLPDDLDPNEEWVNTTTRWGYRGAAHLFLATGASRNFSKLIYGFDSWQVLMAWPKGWHPPAPNRLGWLPKGEFGADSQYFEGLNPDLEYPIAPFTYRDHHGDMFTPSTPVTGP